MDVRELPPVGEVSLHRLRLPQPLPPLAGLGLQTPPAEGHLLQLPPHALPHLRQPARHVTALLLPPLHILLNHQQISLSRGEGERETSMKWAEAVFFINGTLVFFSIDLLFACIVLCL